MLTLGIAACCNSVIRGWMPRHVALIRRVNPGVSTRLATNCAMPATVSLPGVDTGRFEAPVLSARQRQDTFTRAVAVFVNQGVPAEMPTVLETRIKRIILDTLGVAIAGSRHPDMVRLASYHARRDAATSRSSRAASLWGSDLQVVPEVAAFVNGCAAHILDFDDTWHPATHTASPMLPAILALAQVIDASGNDVLRAFAAGMEVQGRLLCAANNPNIPTLFHPVGTVGAMGAAAACSNLLRLDVVRTQAALGIAASRCSGLMANVGSTTKCSHSGHSARMGLEAAMLAADGFCGKLDLLDHEEGFPAAFAAVGKWTPQVLLECGNPHHLERQDVAFKTWPSHLATQWAITAALQLRAEMNADPTKYALDNIDAIYLHGPVKPYIYRAFPNTELDAKFSLQYATALGLLGGDIGMHSFQNPMLTSLAMAEILRKVHVFQDPAIPPSFNEMRIITSVKFADGSLLQQRADKFAGLWSNPLSWDQLVVKFNKCTAAGFGSLTGDCLAVADLVQNLDKQVSVSPLCQLLQKLR